MINIISINIESCISSTPMDGMAIQQRNPTELQLQWHCCQRRQITRKNSIGSKVHPVVHRMVASDQHLLRRQFMFNLMATKCLHST